MAEGALDDEGPAPAVLRDPDAARGIFDVV